MKTTRDYIKPKPIESISLVDKVEKILMNLIINKDFKIGDTHAKEKELSESFGVSRTVVREALSRLKQYGWVKSCRKRGIIITEPDVINNFKYSMTP